MSNGLDAIRISWLAEDAMFTASIGVLPPPPPPPPPFRRDALWLCGFV
jgi:hypothetical protein